jgi:small redox-active disulfide protein 2
VTDSVSIKVLGTGCPNCKKVEAIAREAIADLGVEAAVEKVTDMRAIMGYGIMSTPGLVVEGKVVSAGRIPSKAEVTSWITTALATKQA